VLAKEVEDFRCVKGIVQQFLPQRSNAHAVHFKQAVAAHPYKDVGASGFPERRTNRRLRQHSLGFLRYLLGVKRGFLHRLISKDSGGVRASFHRVRRSTSVCSCTLSDLSLRHCRCSRGHLWYKYVGQRGMTAVNVTKLDN
jgi:hypothetical protein